MNRSTDLLNTESAEHSNSRRESLFSLKVWLIPGYQGDNKKLKRHHISWLPRIEQLSHMPHHKDDGSRELKENNPKRFTGEP